MFHYCLLRQVRSVKKDPNDLRHNLHEYYNFKNYVGASPIKSVPNYQQKENIGLLDRL